MARHPKQVEQRPDVDHPGFSADRPPIRVVVRQTGWGYWHLFKPSHYLDAGPMPFSTAFVGFVDDQPVVHLGMTGMTVGADHHRVARACRMVVMPEWQGAGVGIRFLNLLCQRELEGGGFVGYPTNTMFHTAHPGLIAGLTRDPRWRRVSGALWGRRGVIQIDGEGSRGQMGGHFRAVAGFKYYGLPQEEE